MSTHIAQPQPHTGRSLVAGRRSWLGSALGVALIAVGVGWLLRPTLGSFFSADDFSWLRFVGRASDPIGMALTPSPGGWTTPVSNLYFWLLYRLFGLEPAGYYLANALVHLVNACLVVGIAYALRPLAGPAILTGLVFAVHFIHFSDWGPLVWISAFVQLVSACGYLVALLCFLRAVDRPGRRVGWLGASLLAFVVALGAKETAMSLPLLVAAWGWLFIRDGRLVRREVVRLTLPYAAVLGVYLAYELAFQLPRAYLSQRIYGLGGHLVTNWRYLSNLVMPNPTSGPVNSFLSRFLPGSVLEGLWVIPYLVWVGMLAVGVLVWRRGPRHLRYWLVLMGVTYLPFVGFVEGFAGPNRYAYLASTGFAAVLAAGVEVVWRRWRSGRLDRRVAVASGLVGLALIVYDLVPVRLWQSLMAFNASVRRETIALVAQVTAAHGAPPAEVALSGFPEKFKDLPLALELFRGVPATWQPESAEVGRSREGGQLVIRYADGHVRAEP